MMYPTEAELKEMELVELRRRRIAAMEEAQERIKNMQDSEAEVLRKRDDDKRFWQFFTMLLLIWRRKVSDRLIQQMRQETANDTDEDDAEISTRSRMR